jgi:excisionase family DNA binding protein
LPVDSKDEKGPSTIEADREPGRHPEAVAIPLWQRFVAGGAGPELTLAEAAAALGVSVQTVRRLIQQGKLQATRTASGRLRVSPSLGQDQPGAHQLTDLWQELKRLSALLQATRAERDALSAEVEALQLRLAAANQAGKPATLLSFARSELPASVVGRAGIQGLIMAARKKSKRRLWLWRFTA